MKFPALGALAASLLLATTAQAVTLTSFEFVAQAIDSVPEAFTAFPVSGSGDITLDSSGNLVSANLSLATFTLDLISGGLLLSSVEISGWNHVVGSAATAGGAPTTITSTASGTQTCTVVALNFCGNVAPTVGSWPSTFIDNELSAQMTITSFIDQNNFSGTILATGFNPAGGFATATYTFSVPEPGTALLLGSGLLGLGILGRQRASA